MKRRVVVTLALLVALSVAFLLLVRYWIVPQEGYPTWEAVRNILLRDGEITVTLPDGVEVVHTSGDHISGDGKTVTSKAGYGSFVITVEARIEGQARTLRFEATKLNHWNRIRFDPSDPHTDFRVFENGVEKSAEDVLL